MATDKKRGGGNEGGGEQQSEGELLSSNEVRTGIIELNSGPKAVQYAVVDGMAIFEGDIVLGTVEEVERRTEEARSGMGLEGVRITGDRFRWPNCRIPFTIASNLPDQNRVHEAIAHWEQNTNFRFVARTNETDFITFRPGDGCSSQVGRQGGQQFVTIGSGCLRGQTIHEIGHVIGLWHEQSREDRDSFVRINWQNITPGTEHNFNQHISDGDDVGAYDYGSIMHYGRTAFSRNGQETITPINPAGAQIGQRTALSTGDIAAAGTLCNRVTKQKDLTSDPVTRKELVKDVVLDTRKEQVQDTRKELVLDKRFDPIDPFGPRKFDQVGPNLGKVFSGGGSALPFAMAAPHQAPGAGGAGDPSAEQGSDQAMQLDQQLQHLAEAIGQAEAQVQALQQQYDETLAMLKQLLGQQGRS
jgi:hypothetical protein